MDRIYKGSLDPISVSEKDVKEILQQALKRNLEVEEIKKLMFAERKLWTLIIETACKVKEQVFGNKIFLYVPVYVDSVCVNDCLYCDYRRQNKSISRRTLDFDELKAEVNHLFNKGYRSIELVSGSNPNFPIEKFAKYVEYTKSLGTKQVLMNNRIMKPKEYKLLKSAGLDWVWLWGESYDKEYYGKYHLKGGEKPSFRNRLDSYDYMATAGLNVGIAPLLGLSPSWQYEILSAITHAKYLRKQYGVKIDFGTPRFCPPIHAPLKKTPFPEASSDEVFRLMIALYRLGIRDAFIDSTTREKLGMLKKLWKGGANLTNPEAKTIPGGYTMAIEGEQFKHNSYSVEIFSNEMQKMGLIATF